MTSQCFGVRYDEVLGCAYAALMLTMLFDWLERYNESGTSDGMEMTSEYRYRIKRAGNEVDAERK